MGVNYSGTENTTLYMQAIQSFASSSGCGNCTATQNLMVTFSSCMVDVVVLNQTSRRLLSVLRGYKMDVTSTAAAPRSRSSPSSTAQRGLRRSLRAWACQRRR